MHRSRSHCGTSPSEACPYRSRDAWSRGRSTMSMRWQFYKGIEGKHGRCCPSSGARLLRTFARCSTGITRDSGSVCPHLLGNMTPTGPYAACRFRSGWSCFSRLLLGCSASLASSGDVAVSVPGNSIDASHAGMTSADSRQGFHVLSVVCRQRDDERSACRSIRFLPLPSPYD